SAPAGEVEGPNPLRLALLPRGPGCLGREAGMIKRINGRWRGDVWVRRPGQKAPRVRQWGQLPGGRGARALEQDIIRKHQAERPESAGATKTVEKFQEDFLRFVKNHWKASTLKTYRDAMRNYIIPQLGDVRLSDIGHAQVAALQDFIVDETGL